MQEVEDLLIEIGTEELPPTSLNALSSAFHDNIERGLAELDLGHGAIESFATPRRLACLVRQIESEQPDRQIVRRGPALAAAYGGDGQPTKAALGFARSCGVAVDELETEDTEKGKVLVARRVESGQSTTELVPAILRHALAGLPIAKRMRWGDLDDEFVRPVHWICALLGSRQIEGRLYGVDFGRATRGHRFHHPEPILLEAAADYPAVLRERGYVEPSFARRRAWIENQVQSFAETLGASVPLPPRLLDEVTALCEWPCALIGQFDPGYLEVPPEVLVETMQENQRYFPVYDRSGALLPHFITVANIESHDPGQIRAGNERVIRPRFADAAFFWHQDRKQPLDERYPMLGEVLFHEKLGSLADKAERIARIGAWIGEQLGQDRREIERAARLAKCDLVTQMVFEFPRLQGTMGRYYAQASGEPAIVAQAIEEQYLPAQAGDRLPSGDLGLALSLADRVDSLVGIFAAGERPSGVKDPYGLRRAAIGVVRLVIETPLDLDIRELIARAVAGVPAGLDTTGIGEDVYQYLVERLPGYYQDRGIPVDTVEAGVAVGAGRLADLDQRIRAVELFRRRPEAAALATANKRIGNILRKCDEDTDSPALGSLMVEPAEAALSERITELEGRIEPMMARCDYAGVLDELASLRPEIDAFFDQVLVMADDPQVRLNRLRLLRRIQRLFGNVADVSRLQP